MKIETAIKILGLKRSFTTPQIYFSYEKMKQTRNIKKALEAKNVLLRERVLQCKKRGRRFKPKVKLDICGECYGTGETNYEFDFKEVTCPTCNGSGINSKLKKKCWRCRGRKSIRTPIKIISAKSCVVCRGDVAYHSIDNPVLTKEDLKKIKKK